MGFDAWRVGYLRVPVFPIAVALRDHPEARGHPIALIAETAHLARVADCDAEAEALGIEVDQSASRARARCPALRCLPWDPGRLTDAGRVIASTLEGLTPLVVPVDGEVGAWWFDARGMRWLGGEPGLLERIRAALAELGYPAVQLGVADSAVAARAAARHDGASIVPIGGDVGFLGALPLRALGCDALVQTVLDRLGLRTVGDLRALPRGTLEARFGPEGRAALERALAFDLRRPDGAPPPTLPEAVLVLEEPVAQTGMLVFGLRGILETLAARLVVRGLSATRISLLFSLDDGGEAEEILEPAKPQHHPAALFELCRDRLDRLTFDAPVIEVRARVLVAQIAVPEQVHLEAGSFEPAALDAALDRLQGRFGEAVVMTPMRVDDHRPEACGQWIAVTEAPLRPPAVPTQAPGSDPPVAVHRVLQTPQPVLVRADADGRPVALHTSRGWRPVQAFGPERLSGRWWEDPYAREDWRVCCDAEVLWISREADGFMLRGTWD